MGAKCLLHDHAVSPTPKTSPSMQVAVFAWVGIGEHVLGGATWRQKSKKNCMGCRCYFIKHVCSIHFTQKFPIECYINR